jgi:hypothetical protein
MWIWGHIPIPICIEGKGFVQIFAQLLACDASSEGLSGEGLGCLEGGCLAFDAGERGKG